MNTPGNVTSCGALYMYSPVDGSLKAIEITWTPLQVTIHFTLHLCLSSLRLIITELSSGVHSGDRRWKGVY